MTMSFTRSRRIFMLISIYQLIQIVSVTLLWYSDIPLFVYSNQNGRKEYGYVVSMSLIDDVTGNFKDKEYPWYILLFTWILPWIGNCISLGVLIGVGIGIILESILNIHNRRNKDASRDQMIFVGFLLAVEAYKILGFAVFMTYVCQSSPFCFKAVTRPFYSLLMFSLFGVYFFLVAFYKMTQKHKDSSNSVKEPRIYTYSGINKYEGRLKPQLHQNYTATWYKHILCFEKKTATTNIGETEEAITNLIQDLWNRDIAGIGRDAKGLTHTSIKVESIRICDNHGLLEKYIIQKMLLSRYRGSYGLLESYHEFSEPILTNQKLKAVHNYDVLSRNLDNSINEAYLFHGTDSMSVESILTSGFDVTKCSRPFCGRGVYFAESPVKSDQYTGPPGKDSYVMILSRVLLGNMVVITDPKLMVAQNRPFCSECLSTDCSQTEHRFKHQFDSVVLDRKHGLFREFVLFDDCLAYPEFVITYKRLYGYKCTKK